MFLIYQTGVLDAAAGNRVEISPNINYMDALGLSPTGANSPADSQAQDPAHKYDFWVYVLAVIAALYIITKK